MRILSSNPQNKVELKDILNLKNLNTLQFFISHFSFFLPVFLSLDFFFSQRTNWAYFPILFPRFHILFQKLSRERLQYDNGESQLLWEQEL